MFKTKSKFDKTRYGRSALDNEDHRLTYKVLGSHIYIPLPIFI